MKVVATISAIVILAAFLPAGSLAKDEPPRASDGSIIDLSKWHAIPVHEFMLNITDLPDVTLDRAQRRVRDNSIPHEQIWFDDDKGGIIVEHITVGVYSVRVTNRTRTRDHMEADLDDFWQAIGEDFKVEQRQKIYRYGERAGWVYEMRGKRTGTVCIVAQFGFLSPGKQVTDERYDTAVSLYDCSGKRSFQDVADWINDAKIVEPPYNRVR